MKTSYIFSLVLILLSGCASIQPYYVAVPTGDLETIDFEGEVSAELMPDADFDELILRRAAEDYALVGRADFGAPGEEDWTGAMQRMGRDIKAAKIDYSMKYERTESRTGYMTVPTMQTTYGTAWSPNGPQPVSLTTTVNTHVPYSYSVSCNEYHVYFFKKVRSPSVFGAISSELGDELAKRVGTRNAVLIRGVIPRKQAWKNELFKGDVILTIDGKPANLTDMKAIDRNMVGRKLELWRDGKKLKKTIVDVGG